MKLSNDLKTFQHNDQKMVETNIGSIPIEDYLEIVAMQNGFDSYEQMRAEGFDIDVPLNEYTISIKEMLKKDDEYTI